MNVHDFTLYDVVQRNATYFGEKQAWFEADDSRTLTFAQCKEMVDHLACSLLKLGVSKGDRIGILGKSSLEFFVLYNAIAAVGAIALPINWRLSGDEVAFAINDCEPVLLFADREYHDLVRGIGAGIPSVKAVFNLLSNQGDCQDFLSLLDNSGDFTPPYVSANDGFVIIHTAAVSGRPRGALLSHGNLLCAHMHFSHCLNLAPEDVHLNLLPLFHIGGLVMVTNAFHAGVLTVNMSRFDAAMAVKLIQEKKVSYLFDFAPILASILEQHEASKIDISCLRAAMGLDTPEIITKYQELTGGSFYSMYAQTETSCLGTMGLYNERPGSAGRPAELARVRLVDDDDKPVSIGEIGEIAIRGPMIFQGYWGLPDESEYTFRGGWHHTGDRGRFDSDGFLWYEGRKEEKELIKPGGENVYPAEVERVILQHPGVENVVVFGVPHPKWKEGIKAVCLLRDGGRLGVQELVDYVATRVARYKKPHFVEFVTEFPLTGDGTPDRKRIKEMYGSS